MTTDALPSALDRLDAIVRLVSRGPLLVCVDYDGTLSPIVSRPEDAMLSGPMRDAVKALAVLCAVAVISGRDLKDLRARVGVDGLFYAGSHGFEIEGPEGSGIRYTGGESLLRPVDEAERALRAALAHVPGAQVERKRYSVAAHYRNIASEHEPEVKRAVDEFLARHKDLRVTPGKKVLDMQPAVDWHKGRALLYLLDALKRDSGPMLPLYIGDDITDEDAFRAVRDCGIGIVVRDEPRETAARYALSDTEEVRRFLEGLAAALQRPPAFPD